MAIETISIKDAADITRAVLADLIGSDFAQVLKVGFGTDGSLTLVDAANGLPVLLVGAIPAGTNNIGDVDVASLPALPAGNNNIGDVDVASLPALPAGNNNIGDVDLGSVPAAARTTDAISAALATDRLMLGLAELVPKFAKANVAASQTDSNIVSAVSSKKIRVLSFRIHTAGTATNVTFNSKPAGAGGAISELFACGANGGRAEALNIFGHFETVSGEGLTVTTGAGSTTGIGVVYVEA